VSIHGVLQNVYDDVFVFVHEDAHIAGIVRNWDLVLFDDMIDSSPNFRMLSFSNTRITDVIALGEQTRS
jgi:hypothetical protein